MTKKWRYRETRHVLLNLDDVYETIESCFRSGNFTPSPPHPTPHLTPHPHPPHADTGL